MAQWLSHVGLSDECFSIYTRPLLVAPHIIRRSYYKATMVNHFGSFVLATLICGVAWLFREFLRRFILPSPLNNLPGPPVTSFWKGHLLELYNRHSWPFLEDLTQNYGPVVRLCGPFGTKMLYVFDPLALQSIVKEHDSYDDPLWYLKSNMVLVGPSVLSTWGDHHRKQRKLLNPAFSIAHMRHLAPLLYKIAHKLEYAVKARITNGARELDMLSWMSRAALELVGQGGLGYAFDPLLEDTSDPLWESIKTSLLEMSRIPTYRRMLPYVCDLGSRKFRRQVVELIPDQRVQRLKQACDDIYDRCRDILREKKTALERGDEAIAKQVGEGKDIMSILLRANMNVIAEERLPEDELVAQMSTFVMAGMDTTSNALAKTLHLLAENPDVQATLRSELVDAIHNRDLPYDELMRLPYLDAVCRETLRFHPPAQRVFREALKDAVLPLSAPIRGNDGQMMSEIPVPKGTVIHVGINGSNWNKALWGDDALEWKPERWLSPLPAPLEEAKIPGVYANLMTFMGGRRSCIGFTFSQIEMKVILAVLLTAFTFDLPEEPIVWNLSGVSYPTMGVDGKQPQMILKVGLLSDNEDDSS